jgi:hypothetical protein
MAKKPESKSAKIRKMLAAGADTKTIVKKLGVKPQMVYTTSYQMRKKEGLGAIPKKKEVKSELPKVVNPLAAEKADTSSESVAVSGVEAGGFSYVEQPIIDEETARKIDGFSVFMGIVALAALAVIVWYL